ncbi:hypothetical protein OAN80_04515, partial [Alphaproteobacteria bacterium]|nr:hypothetical protein [Alphaproteobacteria bacterium]
MTEDPGKQIIPLPSGGALQTTSGATRVISTAISDALKIASTEIASEINGIKFSAASILQIQIWSKQIKIEGNVDPKLEDIIELLSKCYEKFNEPNLWRNNIHDGIINVLRFPAQISWKDAKLNLFYCSKLSNLWCRDNQLTELDLSHTPGLTVLVCSD